ncbi:hypothetical protein [Nocardia sp. bgisy118]|uniref:hypothetical protein n=1 Tax=Nocardia sp. bgisy118 TaxID=3413786 RepID=UPI003F4A3021
MPIAFPADALAVNPLTISSASNLARPDRILRLAADNKTYGPQASLILAAARATTCPR